MSGVAEDVSDTNATATTLSASEAVTNFISPATSFASGRAFPFGGVVVSDADAGALLSATIAVSGAVSNMVVVPVALQSLSSSALANALDQTIVEFTGEFPNGGFLGGPGTYPEVVTATITDTAGQSTTLSTTVGVDAIPQPYGPVYETSVTLTSAAETSSVAAQTITGFVTQPFVLGGDGIQYPPTSVGYPGPTLRGATVTLFDNDAAVGTVVSDAGGRFSADVTLMSLGTNVITAVANSANSAFNASASVTDTLLPIATPPTAPPAPITLGIGLDTLALFVSERGEPMGAQFIVSVDGQQEGGVQTTAAASIFGQVQEFDIKGNFPAGPNAVAITYLNASNSLLFVDRATLNGAAVPGGSAVLSNDGTEGFSFAGPIDPSATTIGAGPDTLALFVSERSQPAGAQFTVDVDGAQVGGVQTTSADALSGQVQQFDVLGNFPTGTDTVTINYLNASNSLLFVNSATLDDTAVPGGNLVLSNTGAESFDITGPNPGVPTSITAVGSGPDTLALDLSQRAEPAGAQFTVDVDGTQYGGVQTVTADVSAGQFQELDVLGGFEPNMTHVASIDYLNASNSLLLVGQAAIDGSTIAGGNTVLSNNGSLGFSFATSAAPDPTTIGSGPDTLALSLSEDYFQGNSQFTLSVDGAQLGGVQSVGAIAGNGQSQTLDVLGNFTGSHTVSVDFLNPAAEGAGTPGLARNLYLGGATIDDTAVPNSTLSFSGGMTLQSFTFLH